MVPKIADCGTVFPGVMLSVVKECSRTVVADCRFTVDTGACELVYSLRFRLRSDSPSSLIRCDEWMIRSSMASATVVWPI